METSIQIRMRGAAKRASLSEANLTVLYKNFVFTTFTDLLKNHQQMRTSMLICTRGAAKRASLSEANLTVLYRNSMFTTFTDLLKIH